MASSYSECEKFVGPMSVDVFLSEFVPEAPTGRPVNAIAFAHSSVTQNEDEFIQAIEASNLCPDLKFTNTTSQAEEPHFKPAIAIHSRDQPGESTPSSECPGLPEWDDIHLWIVTEGNEDDFFCLLEEADSETIIEWTRSTSETCSQLVTCSAALNIAQIRVFSFSIALSGDIGRLIRWDRCGAIYTEPFNWASQPDSLLEFLWRFNFLSDVDRGCDTTVTAVGDDEAEAALSKLRKYEGLEDVTRAGLRKFLVRDDSATDEQTRCYIAPSAICDNDFLFGRSTYGFIAYDVMSTNLVYLKDFWRVDRPGTPKEGDVYRELRDAQVPNIAKFGRAGDVPLSSEGVDVLPYAVQRTKTQEYVMGNGSEYEPPYGMLGFVPYVHYRLVLETLGRPLNTFKSSRQLCEVVRDAIVAHTAAYERAHILHRDVSSGNILITEDGSGILIDWHLSKKVIKDVDATQKSGGYSCVGTWSFISISRLLGPPTRPHDVSDDLESFFWLLLYQIAKYRSTKEMDVSWERRHVFDERSLHDGFERGGKGKLMCLQGWEPYFHRTVIMRLVATPYRKLIEDLRSLFRGLYIHTPFRTYLCSESRARVEALQEQDPKFRDAREKLRSSEWMLAIINKHLDAKWDVDDDGSLCYVQCRSDLPADDNPKKRKVSGSNDEEPSTKRRKGPHSSSSIDSEESSVETRRFSSPPTASDNVVRSTAGHLIPHIDRTKFTLRQLQD